MTNSCICTHGCTTPVDPGQFCCAPCVEDCPGAADIDASLRIASKAESMDQPASPNLGKDIRTQTVEHATTALGVITALVNKDHESAHMLINSVEWGVKDTMLLAAWAAQGVQFYAETNYEDPNVVLQKMALEIQFHA